MQLHMTCIHDVNVIDMSRAALTHPKIFFELKPILICANSGLKLNRHSVNAHCLRCTVQGSPHFSGFFQAISSKLFRSFVRSEAAVLSTSLLIPNVCRRFADHPSGSWASAQVLGSRTRPASGDVYFRESIRQGWCLHAPAASPYFSPLCFGGRLTIPTLSVSPAVAGAVWCWWMCHKCC